MRVIFVDPGGRDSCGLEQQIGLQLEIPELGARLVDGDENQRARFFEGGLIAAHAGAMEGGPENVVAVLRDDVARKLVNLAAGLARTSAECLSRSTALRQLDRVDTRVRKLGGEGCAHKRLGRRNSA